MEPDKPGPGDLTQRPPWPGAPQPLCAGAEQSDASAQIGGAAPEVPRPGTGQPLSYAQAGIGMFPQVGSPTVTACRDRLGETPSLQSHRQLPAQLPSCTEPSATKVLFQPGKSSLGSDITYIPTGEGWLYPFIVKDLCARKIVGYACSERTGASLTPEALHLAVRRCKPPKGFVFHSDRASSTPLGPSGSALSSMKFGRACPQGRSLRQRRGRKFLQMSQVRAYPSQTVSHPGQRTGRCIRLLGWLSSVRFEANLPPSCAA